VSQLTRAFKMTRPTTYRSLGRAAGRWKLAPTAPPWGAAGSSDSWTTSGSWRVRGGSGCRSGGRAALLSVCRERTVDV